MPDLVPHANENVDFKAGRNQLVSNTLVIYLMYVLQI